MRPIDGEIAAFSHLDNRAFATTRRTNERDKLPWANLQI